MAIFAFFSKGAECGVKDLYLNFAVGAAGAVGTINRRQGFTVTTPVVRVSAGLYTMNLDQRWQALVDRNVTVTGVTTAADGTYADVTTLSLNVAVPLIQITMKNVAGTAADPPNGSSLNIHLQLKDSTV